MVAEVVHGGYPHGYALRDKNTKRPILTHNNVSNRNEFHKTYNSESLANFIRGKLFLSRHYTRKTVKKFEVMVNGIINLRRRKQTQGQQKINQLKLKIWHIRKYLSNPHPNYINQALRNLYSSESALQKELTGYNKHEDQIKHWKRVKKHVIPKI